MVIDSFTLLAALATITSGGVGFAFVTSNRLAKLEEKVSAADILISHLVKAGENIKEQLNTQLISVSEIRKDISSITEMQKTILTKLEKYDQNIVQFYRDFDRREKEDENKHK